MSSVNMSVDMVTSGCAVLKLGSKIFYVEASPASFGIFQDVNTMQDIGALLLDEPSQEGLIQVSPYKYEVDEEGIGHLVRPRSSPAAPTADEAGVENGEDPCPATDRGAAVESPGYKRICNQPTPDKTNFESSGAVAELCEGVASCSPFKGKAKRSLDLGSSRKILQCTFVGVPDTCTEKHFLMIYKKNLSAKDIDVKCIDFEEGSGVVTVELPSFQCLAALMALATYEYDGATLTKTFPTGDSDCYTVVFSMIPVETFEEKHFLKVLKWRLSNVEENLRGDVEKLTVIKFDELAGTVKVELPSLKCLAALMSLGKIKYDGCDLMQTYEMEEDPASAIEVEEIPTPPLVPTTVTFGRICEDTYDEDHFLKYLKKNLVDKDPFLNEDVKHVEILFYDSEENTLLVEMASVPCVQALKKIKPFKYCGDDLSVKIDLDSSSPSEASVVEVAAKTHPKPDTVKFDIESSLPSQASVVEVPAKPPQKPHTIVTFTGLRRETFDEKHFMRFVREKLVDEDIGVQGLVNTVNLIHYSEEENSVSVEMSSAACVQTAKDVLQWKYRGKTLDLHVLQPESPVKTFGIRPGGGSPDVTFMPSVSEVGSDYGDFDTFSPSSHSTSTQVCEEEEGLVELQTAPDKYPILPAGAKLRSDWPTHETLRLLQACVQYRHELQSRSTQVKGQGWRHVIWFMWRRELFYSVANLKKKLRALIATSEDCGDDWLYGNFVAQYQGLAPRDTSKMEDALRKHPRSQTQRKPGGKAAMVSANKRLCGIITMDHCDGEELTNVFTKDEMTFLLIAEYHARSHKFDNARDRAPALYAEIRAEFKRKGYDVSTDQLCKRMNYLNGRYRYLADMSRLCTGTGVDHTNWIFFDAMGQLHEGRASEEPTKLVSLGSSARTVTRGQHESESSASSASPDGRPRARNKRKSTPSKGIQKMKYKRRVSLTPLKVKRLRQGEKIEQHMSTVASFLELQMGQFQPTPKS